MVKRALKGLVLCAVLLSGCGDKPTINQIKGQEPFGLPEVFRVHYINGLS